MCFTCQISCKLFLLQVFLGWIAPNLQNLLQVSPGWVKLELNYNLNCVVETTLLASNRPLSAQVAILQSHAWSLLPLLFLALCRFHMAEHSSTQKQESLREKRVSSMWNNWSSSVDHEQTNLSSGCQMASRVPNFTWVKIMSDHQPIRCHFVGSGHMSHRQTPA